MTNKTLYILIFCVGFGSYAQERLDLFTLSGSYGFPSSYDSVYQSKATESGVMANLVAPVKLSEKLVWYNSLNYLYWQVYNDENLSEELQNPIRVHGFILRTGIYYELDDERSFQILFAPRLMTDFFNIEANHFQWGGIAVYDKQYHEGLKIGFGLLFNQEFYGPNFVPLVNVDWKINQKWSLAGMFPVYGKLTYKFNERFDAGWSHFGLVTTYRLGDDAYQGDYIERRSIDESFYARVQLLGNFFLEGRVGYAFGRSYKQYDADQKMDFSLPLIEIGDDRTAKSISFEDGIIGSLRVVYSIEIN
ncbi:DUF6268 family outer membrane beta-barrel protein [Namhaeicola litoreus]|uniref:DUF6268 family outer membrane beta-barrel protein n=1 Tax=Namhaeicola litoreus TaxID=1052145 RepID=A0ABW3XYV8_9FLAO